MGIQAHIKLTLLYIGQGQVGPCRISGNRLPNGLDRFNTVGQRKLKDVSDSVSHRPKLMVERRGVNKQFHTATRRHEQSFDRSLPRFSTR